MTERDRKLTLRAISPNLGLAAAVWVSAGSLLALQGPDAAKPPATPPSPTTAPAATPPSAPTPAPPSVPARRPRDPSAAALAEATLDQAVAHQLVQIALADLKVVSEPNADDYRLALAVLRASLRLVPGEVEVVRMALEAAEGAGDAAAVEQMTRRLLELDPKDTVAQLSLVTTRLSRVQDVTERLAMYANLLGPRGESLDASVRSRLALDAAMLAREQADVDQFVKRLSQAAALDPTNKDAAALAFAFYSHRLDDASGRLELLINLLKADPYDPATHLQIAQELAGVGESKQSRRFVGNVQKIDEKVAAGINREVQDLDNRLLWLDKGPASVVEHLSKLVRAGRRQLQQIREELQAQGRPVAGVAEPESIRLDLDSERIRLVAASACSDEASVAESSIELIKSVEELKVWLENPSRRPTSWTEAALRQAQTRWAVEGPWLLLLSGQQTDVAARQVDNLLKGSVVDEAVGRRLSGWVALRKGDAAGARALLEGLDRTDPLASAGLAVLAEQEGGDRLVEARTRYAELWLAMPSDIMGLWARGRLEKLTGQVPPPSSQAEQLGALAAGVPAWVEQVIEKPRMMMSMIAELEAKDVSAFMPARMRVRLRNTGQVPFGVGPRAPLGSRVLVAPVITAASGMLSEPAVAEIIRLDRRLRLMPSETMEVTVPLESGYGGWAVRMTSAQTLRLRWRLLQGFRLDSEAMTKPGIFSLTADTDTLVRSAVRGLSLETGVLAQAVRSAGKDRPAEFMHAIGAAAARVMKVGGPGEATQDQVRELIGALLDRYTRADRLERLFMLTRLPAGAMAPAMKEFDDAIAGLEEPDGEVLLVKVLTRAVKADDPGLKRAAASADAATVTLAALHAARLTEGRRSLSSWKYVKNPNLVRESTGVESVPMPTLPGGDSPTPSDPGSAPATAPSKEPAKGPQ